MIICLANAAVLAFLLVAEYGSASLLLLSRDSMVYFYLLICKQTAYK